MMRDEMQIVDSIVLVDGCCGIYVPVGFYNRYNGSEYLHNANADDMEYIGNTDNMDSCEYWDTWDSIINNAFFIVEGKKYHIEYGEFSGDLMAICYE